MTKGELVNKKYEDILNVLLKDEELMLQVLLDRFGGVQEVWHLINLHITGIHENHLSLEEMEQEVELIASSYIKVLSQLIEREVL